MSTDCQTSGCLNPTLCCCPAIQVLCTASSILLRVSLSVNSISCRQRFINMICCKNSYYLAAFNSCRDHLLVSYPDPIWARSGHETDHCAVLAPFSGLLGLQLWWQRPSTLGTFAEWISQAPPIQIRIQKHTNGFQADFQ